jgi:hypothetical protein
MTALIGQDDAWTLCQRLLQTPCHIFLTGPTGSGKSTLARDLLKLYAQTHSRPYPNSWGEESNDECFLLTPEQDRGIQTIRTQLNMFIRQMAILDMAQPGRKLWRWVVIDDVDTFPQISQQALRRPMETHGHITRFLFIGSSTEDLIPALRSRCIHITLDPVDPYMHRNDFLRLLDMTAYETQFTEGIWNWILNTTQSSIADLMRLLRLLKEVVSAGYPLTERTVHTLCSAPFYTDFLPLLHALTHRDAVAGTYQLLRVWRRGYTFEDILESLQTIHRLYGEGTMDENTITHMFLVNAWIAYCKGNTSILSLQNVFYKTLKDNSYSSMLSAPSVGASVVPLIPGAATT